MRAQCMNSLPRISSIWCPTHTRPQVHEMLSPIRHTTCSTRNISVPAKNYIFHLLVGIQTIIVGSKDCQIWHRMFQRADRWSITFATYSMANSAKIIKNDVAIQFCNLFPLQLHFFDYHLSKCCACSPLVWCQTRKIQTTLILVHTLDL